MPDIKIIKRANYLRHQIRIASKAYYDDDMPIISDAAYDAMLLELRTLEEENPDLVVPDSPTQIVGGHASSSFADVQHKVPLQSLRDVFTTDSVNNWFYQLPDQHVTVETKVDGLSCAITYINGNFTSAATRGDGKIGEDVTENVRHIANVPMYLPGVTDGEIIIRCEVYMPTDVFQKLNAEFAAAKKPLLKNPRNGAAGALRTKDPEETARRGLAAVAFNIMYCSASNIKCGVTQSGDIGVLRRWGFQTVTSYMCSDGDQVRNAIATINAKRDDFPFAIDGAVVKLDTIALQRSLGGTDKYPHWAIAYKYPPEQKTTILRAIDLQTGRTGVITPVAVFDPIELAGTTVSRATLHNQDFIFVNLGGIAVDDTITVHKSGEIIPEVLKVDKSTRPAGVPDFEITNCPVCGSHAVLGADENGNGTQMYCSNPNCPAVLERKLIYWCSDRVMDIEGLGPSTIKSLVREGVWKRIQDIYTTTDEQLLSIDAIGEGRVFKIRHFIEASKHRDIDRLIAGLGIPGVGRHIGRIMAQHYPHMGEIRDKAQQGELTDEIIQLEGIGDITAKDMQDYLSSPETRSLICDLKAAGLNMRSFTYRTPDADTDDWPLAGMTFVITGTFGGFSRNELKEKLESNGAKVSGSVSKKTTYLLAGNDPGSKLDKAKALGVPIIDLDDFYEILHAAETE